MIQCKRVYEQAGPDDGYRVLVDKLWPRGIKKTDLALSLIHISEPTRPY